VLDIQQYDNFLKNRIAVCGIYLKIPIHPYSESAFEGWASEKIALRKFSWLGKK
jgi:hypothetical protein